MNEDEAIEQMELLGHTFFIFFNQETGSINVIYKRRAGATASSIRRLSKHLSVAGTATPMPAYAFSSSRVSP